MTLQSTGAISFSQINTELGLTSTAMLSIDSTAARALAGVASGAIAMSNFYGKTKPASEVISLPIDYQVDALFAGASQASAVFRLGADGIIYYGSYTTTQIFTNAGLGSWITPTSAASNYEVFATLTSGILSSGTTGSWVALGTSNVDWRRTVGAGSVENATFFNIQIRKIGTTTVLDSADIILNTSTDQQ